MFEKLKVPSNMHIISVYFRLNLCKLYDGPIRFMISLSDVFKLNRSHEAVGWYL